MLQLHILIIEVSAASCLIRLSGIQRSNVVSCVRQTLNTR